jgi:hypothetical protein
MGKKVTENFSPLLHRSKRWPKLTGLANFRPLATVFFGQFLKITEVALPNFGPLFSLLKALLFTKTGLGGPFLRNSSGLRGLPDFSWSKHTKLGKIYQMTINNTK